MKLCFSDHPDWFSADMMELFTLFKTSDVYPDQPASETATILNYKNISWRHSRAGSFVSLLDLNLDGQKRSESKTLTALKSKVVPLS